MSAGRRRLPAQLVIGHATYTVRVDQALIDAQGQRDGCRYAGYSSAVDQDIVLAEGLAPDYEAETLLHEVLHQVLAVVGCSPDDDAGAGVKDVEERTVKAAAGPLLATLRANPDLIRYLTTPAAAPASSTSSTAARRKGGRRPAATEGDADGRPRPSTERPDQEGQA